MNWGSLISSVLPTIGTVVGSLLGANKIEDGVVHFAHRNVVGADQSFSSDFYCEDGKYYLFNQSTKSDDVIAMTFPARGQIGAETVLVPGRQSFDVTPMFEDNARDDNSQFELTACSASQQVTQGRTAARQAPGIKISSSGKEIPVGGEKKAIGTYLDVQIEPEQITVLPKNGVSIDSLPMVFVQSGGETGMRVMDVVGEGDAAVVQLPQPLAQNDLVAVDVVANVNTQSLSHMLKLQANDKRLMAVDDETAKRIQNAPKLNWK